MTNETNNLQPEKQHKTEQTPDSDPYGELQRARRGSFLERMNQAFQDALQTSRGPSKMRSPVREMEESPAPTTIDDLAMRRARSVKLQKMTVPESVIIDGSLTSGAETEIAGRIDGNVTVEGRLTLEASALVSGNVKAAACKVDGLVEGKVECTQEVELGETGRLNADVVAGKRVSISGQVCGNVLCGGLVRLASTSKVTGDVRAQSLIIEEGAIFNGNCFMRSSPKKD
ncbi:MAG TPA: polymer-forming cytoskeletal protein [Candidatus Hydrogenedentes bacterium]|nr:polymer-forming cytoskeletal protein [Candidatus Hydrogenedentota bacterium]